MKLTTTGLLSVLGMASAFGAVYAVTPAGGFGSISPEPKVADATRTSDARDDQTVSAAVAGAEFKVDETLLLEGRAGNAKLVKNDAGETFVMLEVTGGDEKTRETSSTSSLALVIDKSGSMRGARFENALRAATAATQRLDDGDSVAVIAFDTKPEVVVPLTTIDASSRARIVNDIRRITLGGDTCISCGIEEGLAELRKNKENVQRMLVLSDGKATAGTRDVPGFRGIGERAQGQGVGVSTIGVDVDYDETLLSAVSQSSNGRHYFVENENGLERVFQEEAARLVEAVASNVVADIDLGPGVELVQVFDRNFTRSGSHISVPLGSIAKGETKTVLVKVRPKSAGGDVLSLADVTLSYRDLIKNVENKSKGKLQVALVGDKNDAGEMDPVVLNRVQRSETATALREANNLFNVGKSQEAQARLDRAQSTLQSASERAFAAPPAARKPSVDKDFERQKAALDDAKRDFAAPAAEPAPVTGGVSSPAPAPPARQGKAGTKRNEANAADLNL